MQTASTHPRPGGFGTALTHGCHRCRVGGRRADRSSMCRGGRPPGCHGAVPRLDHVVVVMMKNKSYYQILRRAAGLGITLFLLLLGFGAQPASAHVSPEHAELVITAKENVTSGRLIVHRDVVSPQKAGAWASHLLSAACPATGSGVAGDSGGVPGGVVVELAWSCHVDRLDLSAMLKQAGLTQVIAEFDGTTVNANAQTPVIDALGAHALPTFPWAEVALGIAAAAALLLAVWQIRTGRLQVAQLVARVRVGAGGSRWPLSAR